MCYFRGSQSLYNYSLCHLVKKNPAVVKSWFWRLKWKPIVSLHTETGLHSPASRLQTPHWLLGGFILETTLDRIHFITLWWTTSDYSNMGLNSPLFKKMELFFNLRISYITLYLHHPHPLQLFCDFPTPTHTLSNPWTFLYLFCYINTYRYIYVCTQTHTPITY